MIPILSSFLCVSYLLLFRFGGRHLWPKHLRVLSRALGIWILNVLLLYYRSLNPEFLFSYYLHQSRIYGAWTEVLLLLCMLFFLLGLPAGWFKLSRSRVWSIALLFMAHLVLGILLVPFAGDFTFYLPVWTPGLIEQIWPVLEGWWGWFFFPVFWWVLFSRKAEKKRRGTPKKPESPAP